LLFFDDGVLQANEIRGGLLNGWRTWEERNEHSAPQYYT